MEGSPMEPIENRQVPNVVDLLADLRKMVNNPDYSDIIFVCKDGVHVHALRLLISARCPVLRSLLMTKEEKVALLDISSTALLSIFEYLYTGTIVKYAPMCSRSAHEMICAARYFQLQHGEEIVCEFLVNNTAEIADDLTKAALRLSVTWEFESLCATTDSFPLSLVKILNSGDLESIHLRSLSEKAFRFFLKRTQSATDPTLSFGEYLRFREIVLWSVTQVCLAEAKDIVDSFLPDGRSAALLSNNIGKVNFSLPCDGNRDRAYLKSLLLKRTDRANLLDNLLGEVDFRRIPADLLAMIVEPLKIVSPSELVAAFCFQTLHKASLLASKSLQCRWEHGSSYCTTGNGSVLAKIEPEVGFARFSAPIVRPYGIYEWDIIMEQFCLGSFEIGFYSEGQIREAKPNFNGLTVAQYPTGWALKDDGNGRFISDRGMSPGWKFINIRGLRHKNARIRVRLNLFDRSGSFSVDGDTFTNAWLDLPHGVYYPSVSLGENWNGKVRMEIVKGFDMV